MTVLGPHAKPDQAVAALPIDKAIHASAQSISIFE
jgi:hypothetical protein